MIGDQGGIGGSRWAAPHCVVDDSYIAETRFLPAQPDGGGAVDFGLDAAWGHWRGAHRWRRCFDTHRILFVIIHYQIIVKDIHSFTYVYIHTCMEISHFCHGPCLFFPSTLQLLHRCAC